ncbi:MAG TPA: M64 family metallopeptidase [Bacteroidales bacterium]|nr:M64 family metallopeptidase [Bacteroidales bacterium]
MKYILCLFLTFTTPLHAGVDFSNWFVDRSMRVDYVLAGDKDSFDISLSRVCEEPFWGGSETNLADTLDYGNFLFEVRDSVTDKLLYSRSFNTLFREWQTTSEAGRLRKAFQETLTFPYPQKTVKLKIFRHPTPDEKELNYSIYINPADILIEKRKPEAFESEDISVSGDSHRKVDLAFIAEGYTAAEKEKFLDDVRRFSRYLFSMSPYDKNRDKFNIRTVFSVSEDSGTDNPGINEWKKTVLNSSFYTFYSERYLTTMDYWKVRDIAACVPYDQVIVLVNTDKYGGGGIFNHYSLFSADNVLSEQVFIHEFGHAFAGLGDEYYTSSVAYSDFYDLDKEPVEPNLTTLVHFDKKWKSMVRSKTPIPTPAKKKYAHTVGAFEGGGYIARGIYRPQLDCRMKSNTADGFCKVCQKAIQDMINFYSE